MTPALWLRVVAVAAVAVAPFLPNAHREGRGRSVMFVVDRSASVGDEGAKAADHFLKRAWEARGDARVGLIAFDGAPEIRRSLDDALPDGTDFDNPFPKLGPVGSPGTDIAAALRLAAASLPDTGERRIVLLTDGNATRGDALAEVRRARSQGIAVDTVPIGATLLGTPTVARASVREPRVAEGEPVTVTAEVLGQEGARLPVVFFRDGRVVSSERVTIGPSGREEVTFTDPRPEPGVHVYEARAGGTNATPGAFTAVDVTGKPRALVVSLDGECPGVLRDALTKSEVSIKLGSLDDDTFKPAALSATDLVVLADVPLSTSSGGGGLSPDSQAALIEFAQKGGGVLVTGGAFGFAPEYGDAPLARMLPVEIVNQGQVEDPRVALAIMLDRSGSMSAMSGSHTKIQLAVEAALAAASTLRHDDQLALGSVDTETHWNQPLSPVSALEGRRDGIRKMDAGGGGIYVYTALIDAYAALKRADAPVRHVILFSDTADSEEQAEGCIFGGCAATARTAADIASTARRAGITTSVVGIGSGDDKDTEFLRKLAAAAGGRFYLTANAAELRRIFVSETRVATRSNVREGAVLVKVADDHPILAGVDVSSMPALGGFVDTKRRATAETALITRDEQKPILASWRYGLGKVVALTTDLRDDWKDGWASFAGAGQTLRQAVRFALRRHGASAVDLRVSVGDRTAEVAIDVAEGPGETAGKPAIVEAFAFGTDGEAKAVPATLEPVGGGRWLAHAKTLGRPFVVARVRDASGGFIGEAIGQVDASEELAHLGADDRKLRSLAEEGCGEWNPSTALAMRTDGLRGRETVPTWPWALLFAAVLACTDLWLRRLGKRRSVLALPVAMQGARAMTHLPEARAA